MTELLLAFSPLEAAIIGASCGAIIFAFFSWLTSGKPDDPNKQF